ncbi:hypothetical protein Tco_0761546 [Tanacetum coccineum]
MKHDSPKIPPGSLPHQPPPPPPPAGSSGTSRSFGAFGLPATPEPAWSIPSSDLPVPMNNWASALASTYAPPPENSLLAQTGDMAMFMDCSKWKNATNYSPIKWMMQSSDLEYLRYGSKGGRPALSISKMKAAYYPDVGLEQMVPDQMWIEEECKYDIAATNGKGRC